MSSSLPLMTSCSGYSVDVCIFRKNGSASNELRDLEVLQPAGRERSLTNLYFQQEERRPGTTLPVKCQPQGTEARPGFQWISRCESAVNIDYYKEENCLWDLVLILDLFLSCTWTDLGVKFLWTWWDLKTTNNPAALVPKSHPIDQVSHKHYVCYCWTFILVIFRHKCATKPKKGLPVEAQKSSRVFCGCSTHRYYASVQCLSLEGPDLANIWYTGTKHYSLPSPTSWKVARFNRVSLLYVRSTTTKVILGPDAQEKEKILNPESWGMVVLRNY